MTQTPFAVERILFPTDFSAFSGQALRHALTLAQRFHARLKVVHVIPQALQLGDTLYTTEPWLVTPETRRRVDNAMKEFLAPVREARLNHEVEIREGDPWREVLDAAVEFPADMVVMGTHGRGGLERFLLGSVTEKLVRRLPCPVLTVSHEEGRTWEAPGLVSRILCATDFSETSEEALRVALALAERHDAAVTVLHAIENLPEFGDPRFPSLASLGPLREEYQGAATTKLAETVAKAAGDFGRIESRVVTGRAYKEVLRLAVEVRADLIVLGAQGHGAFEHLLSGSNAQQVIRQATCPVLTVPLRVSRPKPAPGGSLTLAPEP